MLYYIIFFLPWINSILCQLPEGSVQFYFYNLNYPNGIEIHNFSLSELQLDSSQPLKIWFHGIVANSTTSWNETNTEIYINRGYNYIAVNYYDYSFIYVTVIEQLDNLQQLIGNFLLKFCDEVSVSYADIHMIGHSLGAHLAGLVGRYIYDNRNETVGRITALDPVDLLFSIRYADKRLRKTDALFVDAIHTSFLSVVSFAHADFYPDGGIVGDLFVTEPNSHLIVLNLYTESLNSTDFIARDCRTYTRYLRGNCLNNAQAIMGEHCDPSTRGDFFLDVHEESPFSMGNNTKENSEGGAGGSSGSNVYYLVILLYVSHMYIVNKHLRP